MKLQFENVDPMYGQGNGSSYWSEQPKGNAKQVVTVKDTKQAHDTFLEWVDNNNLGG